MLKKKFSLVNTGIVHVKSTFNNTLICVTDLKGNVIVSGSGGSTGLKGQNGQLITPRKQLVLYLHKKASKVVSEKFIFV